MQTNIKSYQLENGLTVYFYPDCTKHSVIVNLIVDFGGKDTDVMIDGEYYHLKDGMAHLLEHYTIEQNQYGNLISLLTKKFMHTNGITNRLYTSYYFDAVKYIDEGLEILIKGIHQPIFSEQNLEITKHAIREEIRGTQDSVGRRLSTLETEQLFHNRSYRSTIGTISDIDSMTIEDVEKVYRAFYQPSNEIIVVAGNFKEKEMLEKITALYHELSFESHTIKRVLTEEPPTVRNKKAVLNFPTARPIFELSFKIPIGHLTGEQKLKLDWYMSIFFEMNFSILSPIVKKLKDKKVIDKNLVLSSNFFDDYLIVKIGSYTNKKEELEKEIFETLKHPRLDEDVYELSIREKKLKVSLRPEKLSEVIDPFIDNLMYFDYPHLDSVAYLDTFSIQEYQEMISKLDFSNFVKTEVIDKDIDREQEEQQEFVAN